VGKKGAAAARAAERERVGAALIIGVHPIHHRVGPPARAPGHARGAPALRDLEEGESALTGAGVGRAQGQGPQSLRCLTPARIINTDHEP
jgi:hypothetical protein